MVEAGFSSHFPLRFKLGVETSMIIPTRFRTSLPESAQVEGLRGRSKVETSSIRSSSSLKGRISKKWIALPKKRKEPPYLFESSKSGSTTCTMHNGWRLSSTSFKGRSCMESPPGTPVRSHPPHPCGSPWHVLAPGSRVPSFPQSKRNRPLPEPLFARKSE